MKKIILTIISFAFLASVSAQLRVDNRGYVGVKSPSTTTLQSPLSINSSGQNTYQVGILAPQSGIHIDRDGEASYASYVYSLFGGTKLGRSLYNYGLLGAALSPSSLGSGRAYGVFGVAGNSTSGYNYGVMGLLGGTGNGAGIVGSSNDNRDIFISAKFAGYFVGDVRVTGLINGVNVTSSDLRLKQDIVELGSFATKAGNSNSALNKVLKMTPIQYKYKQTYLSKSIATDTATVSSALFDENSPVFKHIQYGLIAQEIQELYPDLVYEDSNGYLSVNYVGLIPILIEAIKELKAEQKTELKLRSAAPQAENNMSDINFAVAQPAQLYQNSPNPFSQSTQIKFYIPENVKSAEIYIFDMQGSLIQRIPADRSGSVEIKAAGLNAGMYLYSLIVDGQEVDTKRMILTK